MLDMTEVERLFGNLNGPGKESLARRMGVAAGRVLRDEAKTLVPISVGPFNPSSRGAQEAGILRDAIFVAYNKRLGDGNNFAYSVSWNDKKAWWGKLVEFGYLQKYRVKYNPFLDRFFTVKGEPSRRIERVPAYSFIGAAMHSGRERAIDAALDAARTEFPKIMAGDNSNGD